MGVPEQPISDLVAAAVQKVKALCAGEGCPWMMKLSTRILEGKAAPSDVDLLIEAVSYTHLHALRVLNMHVGHDLVIGQLLKGLVGQGIHAPVSYTHLDVYKRQHP